MDCPGTACERPYSCCAEMLRVLIALAASGDEPLSPVLAPRGLDSCAFAIRFVVQSHGILFLLMEAVSRRAAAAHDGMGRRRGLG